MNENNMYNNNSVTPTQPNNVTPTGPDNIMSNQPSNITPDNSIPQAGVNQFPNPNNVNQMGTVNNDFIQNQMPSQSNPMIQSQQSNSITNNQPIINGNPNANMQQQYTQSPQLPPNQPPITIENLSQINMNSLNPVNDDELLKAYIGKNYDKITTRPFNFAAFFLSTIYLFYRKMFGYALLLFLLNIIITNIIKISYLSLILNIIIGLVVNKLYVSHAKKHIEKIKSENNSKTMEELATICANKGGTSVGKVFLGLLVETVLTIVIVIVMTLVGLGSIIGDLADSINWNVTINDNLKQDNSSNKTKGTLVKDVIINGNYCVNSECGVTVQDKDGEPTDYILEDNENEELLSKIKDYSDYVTLNIYYEKKGSKLVIVDYKILLKSNNEDISNVKNEAELREKLGLYAVGTYTEILTLVKIGSTGYTADGNVAYSYTNYTFENSKNKKYDMKYINTNGSLNLTKGQKYTVTFEVSEGIFDYEFVIKTIK